MEFENINKLDLNTLDTIFFFNFDLFFPTKPFHDGDPMRILAIFFTQITQLM